MYYLNRTIALLSTLTLVAAAGAAQAGPLDDKKVAVVVGTGENAPEEIGEKLAAALADAASAIGGLTALSPQVNSGPATEMVKCGDDVVCIVGAAGSVKGADLVLVGTVTAVEPRSKKKKSKKKAKKKAFKIVAAVRMIDAPAQEASKSYKISVSRKNAVDTKGVKKAVKTLTGTVRQELIKAALQAANDAYAARKYPGTGKAAERVLSLSKGNKRAIFLLAEVRFAAGQDKDASALFKKALKAKVQAAICMLRLGTLAERAGKKSDALKFYSKALKLGAEDYGARRFLGLALARAKKAAAAKPHLLKARAKKPEDGEINLALGKIAFNTLDPRASEYLFDAARAGAGQGEPDGLLGQLAMASNKKPDARKHLEKAVAAGYRTAAVLTTLGKLHYAAGEKGKAEAELTEAMQLKSKDKEIPYLLAVLAYDAGNAKLAGQYYTMVYKAKDGAHKGEAAERLGRLYSRSGDDKKALKFFKAALSLGRGSFDVVMPLARAAATAKKTKQRKDAASLLGRALTDKPGHPEASFLLGKIEFAAKRYAEALEHLATAAEAGYQKGQAHMLAGRAASALKDAEAARKHYAAAAAAGMATARSMAALGKLQLAAGEKDNAIASLSQARTLGNREVEVAHELAKLLIAAGKGTEARDPLLDVAKKGTRAQKAEAWLALAELASKAGDTKGAQQAYLKASKLGAGGVEVYWALARAALARKDSRAAARHLRAVLSNDRDNAEASYLLGKAAYEAGRYSEARGLLDTALGGGRDTPEVRIALARVALASKDAATATGHMAQAKDQVTADDYLKLARLYKTAKDDEARQGALAKALKLAPSDADAGYELALIYLEAGKVDDALPLLQRAAYAGSHRIEASVKLAEIASAKGDQESYKSYLYAAYQGGLVTPEIARVVSGLLLELGKKKDAAKILTDGLKKEPDSGELNFALGRLHFEGKKYREAAGPLRKAVAANTEAGQAHAWLAVIARAAKDRGALAIHLKAAAEAGFSEQGVQAELGRLFYERKDLAAAEKHLRKAHEANPDDAGVAYLLGVILDDRGDAAARPFLEQALGAGKSKADTAYRLGRIARQAGSAEKATAHFRTALKADPKHAEAAAALGALSFAAGDFAGAAKLLAKADPKDTESAFLRARALFALGNKGEATKLLGALARGGKGKGASYSETLSDFAERSRAEGHLSESVFYLNLLLKAKPGDDKIRRKLGSTLADLGRSGEARDVLAPLAAKGKADPEVLVILGRIEARGGKNEAAEKHFRAALKADPDNGLAAAALAKLLLDTKGAMAAEAVAKQAVDKQPKAAAPHFVLGAVAEARGKKEAAVKAYRAALVRDPKMVGALVGLARLEQDSDPAAAAKHLDTAFKLRARDAELDRLAGKVYAAAKRTDDAIAAYERALKVSPGDMSLLLPLGDMLVRAGRWGKALPLLQDLARRTPDRAEVFYQLGVALEKTGNAAAAEEAYRRFADLKAPPPGPTDYTNHRRSLLTPAFTSLLPVGDTTVSPAAALTALGLSHLDKGELSAAERALSRAADVDPAYVPGRYNLGLARLHLGKSQAAIEDLDFALRAKQVPPEAALALAAAQLNTGDVKAAIKTLEKATTGMLKKLLLGVARARAGDADKAGALFREIMAGGQGQGNAYVLHNIAALTYETGSAAKAREQVSAAISVDPGLPEAQFLAAKLALDSQQPDEAEAHLRRAIAARPDFVLARFELALILLARGAAITGRSELERVVKLAPEFPEAQAKLGELYDKEGASTRAAAAYKKAAEARRKEKEAKKAVDAKVVAVVAFKNNSGKAENDWLSMGIPEALTTDLANLSGLRVVESNQIAEMLQEMGLKQSGVMEEEQAVEIAERLKADLLMLGGFSMVKNEIQINGRLINARNANVLRAASSKGPIDDLFRVERDLALKIVEGTAAVTPEERRALLAGAKTSLDNLRNIAQGRLLLLDGNRSEAKEYFQKALEEDPRYASVLDEMTEAYGDAAATMAILPLKNTAGSKEHEWLSQGIAESLTTDIKKVTGIFMVERMAIDKVLDEHGFAQAMNIENAAEIGKFVGAGILLIGGYQVMGKNLQIDARMVDAESGQILMADKVTGPLDDLFGLQADLARQIAKVLKIDISPEEKALLAAGKPSLDQFKRYIKSQTKVGVEGDAGQLSVAVAPFKDLTGKKSKAAMMAYREYFKNGLVANGGIDVYEREAVLKALADEMMMGVEDKDLSKIAGMEAVEAVVTGGYRDDGKIFLLNARVVKLADGSVVAAASAKGPSNAPEKVKLNALTGLIRDLGIPLKDDLAQALKDEEASAKLTAQIEEEIPDPMLWAKVTIGTAAGTLAAGIALLAVGEKARVDYTSAEKLYEGATTASDAQKWGDRMDDSHTNYVGLTTAGYITSGISLAALGWALYEVLAYEPEDGAKTGEPGKAAPPPAAPKVSAGPTAKGAGFVRLKWSF